MFSKQGKVDGPMLGAALARPLEIHAPRATLTARTARGPNLLNNRIIRLI